MGEDIAEMIDMTAEIDQMKVYFPFSWSDASGHIRLTQETPSFVNMHVAIYVYVFSVYIFDDSLYIWNQDVCR